MINVSVLDCSTPTIANGALGGGSSTRYAGSAFVVCDSGYELAGSALATCLASGNWDTLPVCDPKGKMSFVLSVEKKERINRLQYLNETIEQLVIFIRFLVSHIV